MNYAIAALSFALLSGAAFPSDVSTFPYEHPELDRTPPTVPERSDGFEGEGRLARASVNAPDDPRLP